MEEISEVKQIPLIVRAVHCLLQSYANMCSNQAIGLGDLVLPSTLHLIFWSLPLRMNRNFLGQIEKFDRNW